MKLSQIDELTRPDHSYLTAEDECFYLREYTSKQGYGHSDTNQLILNLKKAVDRKDKPDYRYKQTAIATAATELSGCNLNAAWFSKAALVPVPPSKLPGDPLYDDRITQIVHLVAKPRGWSVRELLSQKKDLGAAHSRASRPTVQELAANYQIVASAATPAPTDIALFDDVLTVGTHFKAAKQVLQARFPGVRVVGFFIARRVFAVEPPTDDE